MDVKTDAKLLKSIIKSTDMVRKKFKAIKSGKIVKEALLEETFKPISKPLKELKEKTDEEMEKKIKTELKKELSSPYFSYTQTDESKSFKTPQRIPFIKKSPHFSAAFETPTSEVFHGAPSLAESTPLTQPHRSFQESLQEGVPLSSYYTQEYINDHDIDKAFGPKYNEIRKEFEIGRSTLKFDDSTITVDEKDYDATRGLYELIFMRRPTNYSSEDLANYQDILLKSNVYKKDYNDEHSQIKGNAGQKYRQIIKKLIKSKQGKGLMLLNTAKPNYIYWDDPNELVDRQRLLIASQQAGHTNHNNEIISIIEELKEAEIIN